jgi:hypothetical protein
MYLFIMFETEVFRKNLIPYGFEDEKLMLQLMVFSSIQQRFKKHLSSSLHARQTRDALTCYDWRVN